VVICGTVSLCMHSANTCHYFAYKMSFILVKTPLGVFSDTSQATRCTRLIASNSTNILVIEMVTHLRSIRALCCLTSSDQMDRYGSVCPTWKDVVLTILGFSVSHLLSDIFARSVTPRSIKFNSHPLKNYMTPFKSPGG
jgi:hypothetical protein